MVQCKLFFLFNFSAMPFWNVYFSVLVSIYMKEKSSFLLKIDCKRLSLKKKIDFSRIRLIRCKTALNSLDNAWRFNQEQDEKEEAYSYTQILTTFASGQFTPCSFSHWNSKNLSSQKKCVSISKRKMILFCLFFVSWFNFKCKILHNKCTIDDIESNIFTSRLELIYFYHFVAVYLVVVVVFFISFGVNFILSIPIG